MKIYKWDSPPCSVIVLAPDKQAAQEMVKLKYDSDMLELIFEEEPEVITIKEPVIIQCRS